MSERFANAMQPILSEDIRYITCVLGLVYNIKIIHSANFCYIHYRYVQFDFHRICGHIHFERLSLLYDQIEDYLKKHGYVNRVLSKQMSFVCVLRCYMRI